MGWGLSLSLAGTIVTAMIPVIMSQPRPFDENRMLFTIVHTRREFDKQNRAP
jgi:hypothetical protein